MNIVARFDGPSRFSKAAAAGPNKDYVYIDVNAHPRGSSRREAPRTSWSFSRTYLGVDPGQGARGPSTRRATTSWAVSPPRSTVRCCANNDEIVKGSVRGRRMRLCPPYTVQNRLGTNSLLDINVFGPSRRHRCRRVRELHRVRRHAGKPRPRWSKTGSASSWSDHGHERVADIRTELQQSMDNKRLRLSAPKSASPRLSRIVRALKERYNHITVQDKGKRYKQRTCSRPSSWASSSKWQRSPSSGALNPQGIARRPRSRGLPGPQRPPST